jgi:hypothetical protein
MPISLDSFDRLLLSNVTEYIKFCKYFSIYAYYRFCSEFRISLALGDFLGHYGSI